MGCGAGGDISTFERLQREGAGELFGGIYKVLALHFKWTKDVDSYQQCS
jgi:hypothetical protein